MRFVRILAPMAAVAALALPASPARAVNTPVYTFTVDCAVGTASTAGLGVELPSGRYLVTVAGACSYDGDIDRTVPVSTCLHPLEAYPCVNTGVSVSNVPGEACIVGAGTVYAQTCVDRGVWQPLCDWWFTVKVNDQCLTTVPHQVGIVQHNGGAMTARVVDGNYADNIGVFTVTAVLTPL